MKKPKNDFRDQIGLKSSIAKKENGEKCKTNPLAIQEKIMKYRSRYTVVGDYTHRSIENALNHKNMMESIANDIVEQALEEYELQRKEIFDNEIKELLKNAYREAINDFMEAIRYDIESVVEIGFDGCEQIFKDKKTQKIISDRIIQEIYKKLNK